MVFPIEARLRAVMADRAARGLLRTLTHADGLADFSSNDYLGLARSPALATALAAAVAAAAPAPGSTGSRLLTGNSHLAEALEQYAPHAPALPAPPHPPTPPPPPRLTLRCTLVPV
jgi:8-amino-7-oxononanoate synthase